MLFSQSETSITPPTLGDDSSVNFDLSNQSYYLLLALGPMEGSNIGYHIVDCSTQLTHDFVFVFVFHDKYQSSKYDKYKSSKYEKPRYHSGGQVVSGDKVNLAEFSAPQMDKNVLITLHAGEEWRFFLNFNVILKFRRSHTCLASVRLLWDLFCALLQGYLPGEKK